MAYLGSAALVGHADRVSWTLLVTVVDENGFDVTYFVPKTDWRVADPNPATLPPLPNMFVQLRNPDTEFEASEHMLQKMLATLQAVK